MESPLVTAEWLHEHIDTPNLIILDASQKPNDTDNISIKGARRFDIKNQFSDPESELPNTLPSPAYFEQACQQIGIHQDSKIVVYDNQGIFSSPRVWWMFTIMGHQQVAVLDGGLPAWLNKDYETEIITSKTVEKGSFKADFDAAAVKYMADMVENVNQANFVVVDARSSGRFEGTAPEPRAGLKSGHIPNSISLPFKTVLHEGHFKSKEALGTIFKEKGLTDQALIFSCGSGITACVLALASELATGNKHLVFDGSWTQWATEQGLTVD